MRLTLILVGLISFPAALLLTLPAEKALNWWSDDLHVDISLHAAQGGLAGGSAAAVSIDGLQLGQTRWEPRLLSLFKARLGYHLQTELDGRPASALIEMGFGGRLSVHDLAATAAIERLLPLFSGLVLPVDGLLIADIEQLRIKKEVVQLAEGQIRIEGAGWRLMRPPLALGDFLLQLRTADDIVTVAITDEPGAAVDAEGAVSLNEESEYQLDLSLRARGNADPRLGNLLKGLGAPDAKGWYKLKSKGKL